MEQVEDLNRIIFPEMSYFDEDKCIKGILTYSLLIKI